MPRTLRKVIGGIATAALLAGPAFLFIRETHPYAASRTAPPQIRLSDADEARARSFTSFEGAIPVLSFHDVSDKGSGKHTLSPKQFAAHLATLRAAGFESVGLDDVARFVAGEPVRLPSRPIVLTFDDGPTSNFTVADPVLAEYGFRGVAFLITGRVASREPSYYLTWEQIASMRDNGRWEFGAHTHRAHAQGALPGGDTGPSLMNRLLQADGTTETLEQWRARVSADLDANARALETRLGHPPPAFAFPSSAAEVPTNDASIRAELGEMVAARFPLAFGGFTDSPVVLPSSRPHGLPRISMVAGMSTSNLLERLHQSVPLAPPEEVGSLPWRSDEHGTCVSTVGDVVVSTSGYTRCQLSGNPAHWRDYRLSTAIRGNGRTATAIMDVRSGRLGRAEVAIGESTAKVRQQLGKAPFQVLGEIPLTALPPDRDRTVRLTVRGDRLDVEIDGLPASVFHLSASLRTGFAGFAVAAASDQTVTFLRPTVANLRSGLVDTPLPEVPTADPVSLPSDSA